MLQFMSSAVFLLEKHVSSQAFFTFFPGFSQKIIVDILQGCSVYIAGKGQHIFFSSLLCDSLMKGKIN